MEFFTIEQSSQALYKEKGSKFLSFAFPVMTEADIKNALEEVRSQYHDARHHCYAWVLGMENQAFRANDDGEPSHTAGDPILGQIRSFKLTNVLVVVVRYFGGTKLGVGGLISAYKIASENALKKAGKRQIFEREEVEIKFSYASMSIVERLIADFHVEVTERDFRESCMVRGEIKKDDLPGFDSRVKDLYELEITVGKNE
jgi:uncharacterized YigZ family protein